MPENYVLSSSHCSVTFVLFVTVFVCLLLLNMQREVLSYLKYILLSLFFTS